MIIMTISLVDYIRWFSDNHAVKSLDSDWDGVVVATIGSSVLIRLGDVKE